MSAVAAAATPSTPDGNNNNNNNHNNNTSVRIPTLSELSDASLPDDSALTDTQRRIARRRVLEARARATMAELDTLTKTFQHLSPVSGTVVPTTAVSVSAPVTPVSKASSTSMSTLTSSPSVTSAAAAATAAVRVRDVLLLSRNGQLLLLCASINNVFLFCFVRIATSNDDVDEENLQAFDTRDVASRLEAERASSTNLISSISHISLIPYIQ
jgi:hypothetical protein